MKEQIKLEIRKVLNEIEDSSHKELIKLRTFHYNVHHIIFNPEEDMSCQEIISSVKKLLSEVDWH